MDASNRRIWIATVSLPLAWGLVESFRSAWVCDDVFISFRYVDQLLQGNGLVFNVGEQVEGFTHFLWLMVLALCARLGLDLVVVGRYLPILAFAGVLFVLARRAWERRDLGVGLPLAAWCVALHRDAQIFASSGLETAPFTLLVLLGLLATSGRTPRMGLAGALYALATLTRPEGALYTALAAAYLVWRVRSIRPLWQFAGTWVLLIAPFLTFRVLYYDQLLPNTYYAKSAGHAYWSQGWIYTRLYFGTYGVLVAAVAALPLSWVLRARARNRDERRSLDSSVLASLQVIAVCAYVARVGGDFMFARFFIPVTPLLLLVLEDVLGVLTRFVAARWRRAIAALLVLACVGLTVYARVPRGRTFVGRTPVEGVVDEAHVYTREILAIMKSQGEALRKYLSGTGARLALLSGQDAVAYFSRLPYALEPHGLTDAELARTPLQGRGRPGHERAASLEDLLRRNVHIRMRYTLTIGLRLNQQIRFDEHYAEIIFYDSELMARLRRPGVNFVEFPVYLDDYIDRIDEHNPKRLLDDYVHFQLFYFVHNDDPERQDRLRAALLDLGVPESAVLEAERRVRVVMQRVRQPDSAT